MDADVMVIGAGVAGLSAARTLVDEGARVIVIEARDRIGGRVFTDRSLGVAVDLGASWIQGVDHNPIAEIARAIGARTLPTDWDDLTLFARDGTRVDDDDRAELDEAFEELVEALEAPRGDCSVAEAIAIALRGESVEREVRSGIQWRETTLEVESGADLAEMSLRAMLGDDEDDEPPLDRFDRAALGEDIDGDEVLFPEGYDQVVQALARGLDLRLGRPVLAITQDASGVRVDTAGENFRAQGAIVTLPVGVLKAGTVRFDPALPAEKLRAIESLGFGVLDKVALRFPSVFWPQGRAFIGYASATRGEFPVIMDLSRVSGAPVLVAFTGGSYARRNESRTDAEVVASLMRVLRTLFGARVPEPSGHLVARWASDPYARGVYPFDRVGARGGEYFTLGRPFGRLLFAGEATHPLHAGLVHGAWLSGQREARRALAMLRGG